MENKTKQLDSTNDLKVNDNEAAFLEREETEKEDSDISDRLKECEGLEEEKLYQYLNELSEEELLSFLQKANEANETLAKENDIFEFILKEDQSVQNALEMLEMDVQSQASEDTFDPLTYPAKCYFARKRLEYLEKAFEERRSIWLSEILDLKFLLESLNISLQTLKEAEENFNKNIRFGGRHPVTKKVILQKVAKYFDDSIKHKMAMTNRCKIQVQHDTMERNKLLSQVREQEKRLASMDLTKYQEAKFEHDKTYKSLLKHRDQLAKCKSKHSSLIQNIAEIKRYLEKSKSEMQEIQTSLSKKEHLKNVMISGKTRNIQKMEELNAAMRKIRVDPRRHGLPEVAEYAFVKRENEILKQNIKKWKKKVAVAEQAKLMHLSALKKKKAGQR